MTTNVGLLAIMNFGQYSRAKKIVQICLLVKESLLKKKLLGKTNRLFGPAVLAQRDRLKE